MFPFRISPPFNSPASSGWSNLALSLRTSGGPPAFAFPASAAALWWRQSPAPRYEQGAREEVQGVFSRRVPVPVRPLTRQYEGDATLKLRAPLSTPRHRREKGKPRIWRCVSARVARRPAAFRPGRTDLALAGPGSPWGSGRWVPPRPQYLFGSGGVFSRLRSPQRLSVLGHLVSTLLRGVVRITLISKCLAQGLPSTEESIFVLGIKECCAYSGWMADKPMIIGTSRSHLEQIMGAALWNLEKQGNKVFKLGISSIGRNLKELDWLSLQSR